MNKFFVTLAVLLFGVLTSTHAVACELRFMGDISNESMDSLLTSVEDEETCPEGKNEKIRIVIQSEGGQTNPMQSAVRQLLKKGVDTHLEYSIASAAVALYLAGENRTMAEDAYIYLHPVAVWSEGEPSANAPMKEQEGQQREKTLLFERATDDYVAFIASRTKLSKEQVLKMMSDRTMIYRDKAILYGFATE